MSTRAAVAALAAIAHTASAAAQTPPPRVAQEVMLGHFGWDIAWASVGAGLSLSGIALQPRSDAQVAPLDGAGQRAWDPSLGTASDVVLWGGLGLSVGAAFLAESVGAGSRGWRLARAPMVLSEAALMAVGLVSMTKSLGSVCRPRAWRDATGTCESDAVDDRRSFPSGHTAPLAAMAGASLGLWLLPSRAEHAFAPLFAATTALAGTNLVLRVAAGAHSWVDTSVGFVGGFALGLATAALHTRRVALGPAAEGRGLAVSVVF
jgi:membrane-associated phospholipid phosphatase